MLRDRMKLLAHVDRLPNLNMLTKLTLSSRVGARVNRLNSLKQDLKL
jgi:hypothetical protein